MYKHLIYVRLVAACCFSLYSTFFMDVFLVLQIVAETPPLSLMRNLKAGNV